MDLGLLTLRLVVGLPLAGHGAQKLFGLFGGFGLAGTGGYLEGLGYRPGRLFALLAGLAELGGGLLLALGLATPAAGALVVATMVNVYAGQGPLEPSWRLGTPPRLRHHRRRPRPHRSRPLLPRRRPRLGRPRRRARPRPDRRRARRLDCWPSPAGAPAGQLATA
jgi:hypothetical protein